MGPRSSELRHFCEVPVAPTCELINTYDVLEHVLGLSGLHPHSLSTMAGLRRCLFEHVRQTFPRGTGVLLDVGCGSGDGAAALADMLAGRHSVVGIDVSRRSIDLARQKHAGIAGLGFFHGSLEQWRAEHSGEPVLGAICASMSMFVPDLCAFYRSLHSILTERGMLIDAPFLFSSRYPDPAPDFQSKTYSVCGCDMRMHRLETLRAALQQCEFADVRGREHPFELMYLGTLLGDYPAWRLACNLVVNIWRPNPILGAASSGYLLRRTSSIFAFFVTNRRRFSSGELVAIKG